MLAYGICVFTDMGENGFLNPMLDQGYELIPIPETNGIGPNYDQIIGVTNTPLDNFIPRGWLNNHPIAHFDPDFVHNSYGDNFSDERLLNQVPKKLGTLKKGDLLVIFARMKHFENGGFIENTERVYIVGWLKVFEIVHFFESPDEQIGRWLENANFNSHFLAAMGDIQAFRDGLNVVCIGDPKSGGQLKKPILFTGARVFNDEGRHRGYPILPEMIGLIEDNHILIHMIGPYRLNFEGMFEILSQPENLEFVQPLLPQEFR